MIPNPNPESMVFTHRRPLAFPSTVFEETGSQQGHWQRTKRVLLSGRWATSCFSSVPAPGSLYSAAKVSEESYRTQLESVGSVCSFGGATDSRSFLCPVALLSPSQTVLWLSLIGHAWPAQACCPQPLFSLTLNHPIQSGGSPESHLYYLSCKGFPVH